MRTTVGERYIFSMRERGFFALMIAVGLLIAGLALVPVGSGPYTVVYGPASALRAQRAFLFLTLVWVALAALAPSAIPVRSWFVFLRVVAPDPGSNSYPLPSLTSGLRC